MRDLQSEIERLYESASLTDELQDAEAKILLQWGEKQVKLLAFGDGDFEDNCKRLRQFMKYLNRFVGQRQYMDDTQQLEALATVEKWATRLGWTQTADQMHSSLGHHPDHAADLNALLALFEDLGPSAGNDSNSMLGP